MNELAKELGLIVPEGRKDTAVYVDGKTFGMYEFSDGTVCSVISDPNSDQNLVVIDSHLGTPAPAELDLGRIDAFTTYQASLALEDFVQ